jgi:hypothetical protein
MFAAVCFLSSGILGGLGATRDFQLDHAQRMTHSTKCATCSCGFSKNKRGGAEKVILKLTFWRRPVGPRFSNLKSCEPGVIIPLPWRRLLEQSDDILDRLRCG